MENISITETYDNGVNKQLLTSHIVQNQMIILSDISTRWTAWLLLDPESVYNKFTHTFRNEHSKLWTGNCYDKDICGQAVISSKIISFHLQESFSVSSEYDWYYSHVLKVFSVLCINH